MINFIIFALMLPVTFFAWAAVHELSHFLTAKALVGAESVRFKLYPHKEPVLGFCWASVSFVTKKDPTPSQRWKILLAPRLPGAVALVMLPLGIHFAPVGVVVWAGFWLGGAVDFLVGFLACNPASDLQRVCRVMQWNLTAARVVGLVIWGIWVATAVVLYCLSYAGVVNG